MRSKILLALLMLPPPAAMAGPPGTLVIVDDPALGAFDDITFTGIPVSLADDGETMLPTGPFAGNFVLNQGAVAAGQNGGLNFGALTVTDLAPVNQPIPSQAAFAGMQSVLAFWDDIDDKDGDVYALERVKGGRHAAIMRYNLQRE